MSNLVPIESMVQQHLAAATSGPRSRRDIVAIYSGGSTARAWETCRALCERSSAVMLHDAPRADLRVLAAEVRATGAALWYGVGIDGWARDLRSGARSRAQIAARAALLATIARDQGAELIMWNGEAAWKHTPGTDDTDARIEGSLAEALASVHTRVKIPQGFTSFDHPTWHRVPWREALGPDSPVVVHSLQRYGALGAGAPLATPAQLRARCERSAAQLRALVARGDCRPDLADGGAGCLPYLQLHGVQAHATVAYALSQPGVALWALPTRSDPAGEEALRLLAAIWRAGLWGDVRALQRAIGVADDGRYGRISHAAALAWARRTP